MHTTNELDQWISGVIASGNDGADRDFSPVLRAIEQRVGQLLDSDPGLLMSYLYRLDVAEGKVKNALMDTSSGGAVRSIARLIFDRQMERLETKRRIPKIHLDDDDWSW